MGVWLIVLEGFCSSLAFFPYRCWSLLVMRIFLILMMALLGVLPGALSGSAHAEVAAAPAKDGVYGLWLVESKRAAVEITDCEGTLCGHVVWIIEGGLMRDENNPKKALRDRPVCGMKLLRGFERDEPGQWSGGKIYNAKEGKTYKATIKVKNADTLFLRGYVGIPLLGKTQEWTRLPDDHARCEPPKDTPPQNSPSQDTAE